MATDQPNYDGDYNEEALVSLSQEDRELVINPTTLTDQYDLRRIWEVLHKIEVRGNLLSGWIKCLPAGYERVLRVEDRDWLWRLHCDTVPNALQMESSCSAITPRHALRVMHECRIRANALGIESMEEYTRTKLVTKNVKESWTFNDSEDYFSVERSKSDECPLYYSSEYNHIVKLVLVQIDSYADWNNSNSPDTLRYVLEKWRLGKCNKYQKKNNTLLRYAVELILHLHTKYGCTKSISSLSCYTNDFSWTPGTVFIPDELRDELSSLLMDIPYSYNAEFIRNYYQAASEPILQSIHDKLSKDVLRMKREGDSKCVIQ